MTTPSTPDVGPEEKQRLFRGRFYRCTGMLPDGDVKTAIRSYSRRYLMTGLEGRVRCLPYFTPVRMILVPSSKYIPANNRGTGNCGSKKDKQ